MGAWRFASSCRSAICGSCAMTINGTEQLACRTSLRKELERHGHIGRAAPQLAGDARIWLWIWRRSGRRSATCIPGWCRRFGLRMRACLLGRRHRTMAIRSFHNVDACHRSAALASRLVPCMKSRRGFAGPAALAKADRFLSTREESRFIDASQTLGASRRTNGIWDCTRCNFCVPKSVRKTSSRWKRSSGCGGPRWTMGLAKTGGARHILGFTHLSRTARAVERAAIMPLKVVGFSPRGLLHPASGHQDVPQRENPQPIWTCAPWAQPSPGFYPSSETSPCRRPNPALFMNTSAAIADPLLRRAFGRRARPLDPHRRVGDWRPSCWRLSPSERSGTGTAADVGASPLSSARRSRDTAQRFRDELS